MKKLIYLCIILTACTGAKNENQYEESAGVHNEAIKLGKEVESKFRQIEQYIATETPSDAFLDSINSIKEDYLIWTGNLIEVPGNEHDHHDHAGHDHHDHDHGSSTNLTPEQMLTVQTELKNQIQELNKRIQLQLDELTKEIDDKPDKE
jgi:hypothetical protein